MPYISNRRISPPNRRKEYEDTRNNRWSKYYNNPAWKRLREWYIINHPLCECCMFNGISKPATEIHHRVPYSWWNTEEDRIKALTCTDLFQSLCRKCHMNIHKTLHRPNNFEETEIFKKIHNMI